MNEKKKSEDQSRWVNRDASKQCSDEQASGDVMVMASKPEIQVPGTRQMSTNIAQVATPRTEDYQIW